MGTELVLELIKNRFFPVLGTVECSLGSMRNISDGNEPTLVGKHAKLTWDCNNGTVVIYDGEGKPWIRSIKYVNFDGASMEDFAARHCLKKGAMVPHSNDGGKYKRLVAEQTGEQI